MKAIIMAGGEGTRLRPVSANKPKPMVELFDQPVLAHIIELLKENGITEACLTLKYLPQVISDYFGSGEGCGVRLHYRIETAPLGTAGGVLNCADFIGSDDVLIISGDCVCDFDLKSLMVFHREKKAEATLALYSHKEPLEYGLVVTDGDGRILRFTEKPAWDNVVTDQINTGIYVLSPSILQEIPAGTPYDFGRELFPRLLKENRALFGCLMPGYWCDIGNIGAYLKCCQDALSGGIRLLKDIPEIKKDVWSLSDIPDSAHIVPPVYIGREVTIGKGAVIGPGAVVGRSSVIEPDAQISGSVVCGAAVGAGASLCGSVVGRDADIGRGSVLAEGSAVGDRTVIGRDCRIGTQARIWPDKQIPDGAAVTGSLEHGMLKHNLVFTKPGVMTGEAGVAVTTESCLRLGVAAAAFAGENRRVGVAWRGGDAARVLAEAFGCGVNTAGGELLQHDGGFPSCASFVGFYFSLPLSVFFEEHDHEVSVYFFEKNGARISRELERKFESACDADLAPSHTFGALTSVTGVLEAYVSAAAHAAHSQSMNLKNSFASLVFAVPGRSTESRALKRALRLLGCTVTDRKTGIVTFEIVNGGLSLTATDEEGYSLSPEKLLVISSYIAMKNGVPTLALPYEAPGVIDDMAGDFGTEILRAGRDGAQADALLTEQRMLCDAVFAAASIAAFLGTHGETLAGVRRLVPSFSSVIREVPIQSDRGAVMRGLMSACTESSADTASGLSVKTDYGIVRVSPLRDRNALRIRVESFKEEMAEELCAEFERRALEADQK